MHILLRKEMGRKKKGLQVTLSTKTENRISSKEGKDDAMAQNILCQKPQIILNSIKNQCS